MVLPMDMKNLRMLLPEPGISVLHTYPNVAPDPSMYCPSVLMTPFGPAPYLMMLTEPVAWLVVIRDRSKVRLYQI